MVADTREVRLVNAFVTLADTRIAGYDVATLLQTLVEACTEVLDVSAAGIMLAGLSGELSVVAATSQRSRLLELTQLSSGNGPCVESFTSGIVVALADVESVAEEWPDFTREARAQGMRAVHAVPLRLRSTIVGTLNLFLSRTGRLSAEDASAAQGLADVATIGILHERAARESDTAKIQLQRALDSRVIIEQAKGVVAQTRDIDMDSAFTVLRSYARSNNVTLRVVAEQVVARTLIL